MTKSKEIGTYYEPLTCYGCNGPTHAGEVIAVPVNKPELYADNDIIVKVNRAFICPACYVKYATARARHADLINRIKKIQGEEAFL